MTTETPKNRLHTEYYENGQIEAVAIFKDNEGISGDCDYFKDV